VKRTLEKHWARIRNHVNYVISSYCQSSMPRLFRCTDTKEWVSVMSLHPLQSLASNNDDCGSVGTDVQSDHSSSQVNRMLSLSYKTLFKLDVLGSCAVYPRRNKCSFQYSYNILEASRWWEQLNLLRMWQHLCVQSHLNQVPFKVLTALIMKLTAFRKIVSCTLVEVNWGFRGAYCLHH
jgi:hypothetical protein